MSSGIRVTATDLASPEQSDTIEIMDNYVLITAGTCHQTYVQVHHGKGGTQTHVITVKGIRQPVPAGQEAEHG